MEASLRGEGYGEAGSGASVGDLAARDDLPEGAEVLACLGMFKSHFRGYEGARHIGPHRGFGGLPRIAVQSAGNIHRQPSAGSE
jgi:hypothetical protein